MPANYDLTDLQPILPFTATEDDVPFPWQASTSTDHVLYFADDRGIWLRVPDNDITGREFEALTGFRLQELTRKKVDGLYIYTLKSGEPLLPFPFTATQLRELDQRTSGVFSERISCQFGEADEAGAKETAALIEEMAQSYPKAAELARAVIYGELPPEQNSSTESIESSASNIPANDYSMLATRRQLLEVFRPFTGMDASWFDNLQDTPALLKSRKVVGQGGRGHILEPWFCPFEVMQWLTNPKRRKNSSRKLSVEKGWELLEKNFPKVYNAHSVADPRTDD